MSEIDKLWQHPDAPFTRVTLMKVPTLAEALAIAVAARTDERGLLIGPHASLRLPMLQGFNDYEMLAEVAQLWMKGYPP